MEHRLSCFSPRDSADTSLSPGVCDTSFVLSSSRLHIPLGVFQKQSVAPAWCCWLAQIFLPGDFFLDFCASAVVEQLFVICCYLVIRLFYVGLWFPAMLCSSSQVCTVYSILKCNQMCNAVPLSDFLSRSARCWLTPLWSASVKNRLLGRSWTTGGNRLFISISLSFQHRSYSLLQKWDILYLKIVWKMKTNEVIWKHTQFFTWNNLINMKVTSTIQNFNSL